MKVLTRARHPAVALETTLLVHGVPREAGPRLAADLSACVRGEGAWEAIVGVVAGVPTVGMSEGELASFFEAEDVCKCNASNLGVVMHRRSHGATTVSATLEIASAAGLRVFATGGLGGVHKDYASRLDVSGDLAALARIPMAVVCSGVKSLLDVPASREVLETLGVPVVGFGTDRFPAFYLRDGGCGVDARFDDVADLAGFVRMELARSGRGVVVAHPIPESDAIDAEDLSRWLAEAEKVERPSGRDVTPSLLAHLHMVSGGATLRSNLALVRANAVLAARLSRAMERGRGRG